MDPRDPQNNANDYLEIHPGDVNLVTDPTVRTYTNRQTGEVLTYQQRLEDGQLLLMQIPGT